MPGGRKLFESKKVGETCFTSVPFDFINSLAIGEAITSQNVVATVYSGYDANPSAIISGSATVENVTQVMQLITGGLNGVIYELNSTITTNRGQTLTQNGLLAVYSTPTGTTPPTGGFPFGTGAFGVTGF